MTRELGIFTLEDTLEIGRRVLGNQYKQPLADNTRDKTVHNDLYYVVLTEALDVATNPRTGYTTAEGRILRYLQPVISTSLDMEDSTTHEGLIDITNRFTTFSASIGDVLLVIRNESEWSPINVASSGALRHAVVDQCYGNGYYIAYFPLDLQFSFPDTSETGTGTIAGVGTGSGLLNECDMCSLMYGETEAVGTAALSGPVVCGTLVQPSRVAPEANGDLIYIYDPRLIKLRIGAHVIVADLGDRIPDPGLAPEIGTGTGTAENNVILWMVQTGNYPLIGIPDRFYQCCDGDVVLIRCDMYITEGYHCEGHGSACLGTGTL